MEQGADLKNCTPRSPTTVGRIADTLEVLTHDGYLESSDEGYCFPSRLLRDWWSARFRGHYVPLERRRTDDDFGEPAR